MDRRTSYGQFIRDVVLVGVSDGIKSLRLLLVTPILTKAFGAQGYGSWAQVKIVAMCLSTVALLGLQSSIVRFLGGEQDARAVRGGLTASTALVAVSGLSLAAILFICSRPLASVLFHEAQASGLVQVAAVLVVLEALDQLALAFFQASRNMGQRAVFIWIEVLVEVALVAMLAAFKIPLMDLLRVLIGWKGIIVALKFFLIWSRVGFGLPALGTMNAYLAFGLPLLLSSLFYCLLIYSDRFVIASLLDMRAVGLYSVAYMLGGLIIMLLTPIDYVLYPTIAAAWNRGDHDGVRRYLRHTLKYVLLLLVPVVCWLTVLARPVLSIVSTKEFLPAASSIPLIGAGFLVFGIGVAGERVLLLAKRQMAITVIYGMLALTNVVLNLLLIPLAGIQGAAFAMLLSFAAYATVMLSMAQRYCTFSVEWSTVWKSSLAALVVSVPMRAIGATSLAGITVSVMCGALGYLLLLVFLKSVSAHEVRFLLHLAQPWKAQGAFSGVGAGE